LYFTRSKEYSDFSVKRIRTRARAPQNRLSGRVSNHDLMPLFSPTF